MDCTCGSGSVKSAGRASIDSNGLMIGALNAHSRLCRERIEHVLCFVKCHCGMFCEMLCHVCAMLAEKVCHFG